MTLEDYPMEHGVAEARQRAREVRLQRSKVADWMMSVREESESLRDYGRYRFQTAVESSAVQDRSGPGPLFDDTRRRRPVTVSGYPSCHVTSRPPTNGPTRDGSVLYRTTPLVLSAIRTRPRSESISRFNHMRGTTESHPSIQQALMQSNCEYRLVTSPTSGGQQPGAGQGTGFVMFVPMITPEGVTPTQEEREDTPLQTPPQPPSRDEPRNEPRKVTQPHEEKEERMSEMESNIGSKEDLAVQETTSDNVSVDEILEDKAKSSIDRTVQGKVGRSGKDQENVSTVPRRQSGKKKSQKQSTSASIQSREQLRPLKTTSANQKKRASPKGKSPPLEVKSQSILHSSPPSSKSAASLSISTTSIIHHPHCWVDDVSISSDEQEVEMQIVDIAGTLLPGSLPNIAATTPKTTAASKLAPFTPLKSKITPSQRVEDWNLQSLVNIDTRAEELESERPPTSAQVIEGEEKEKEVVLTFPHLLCPSSERRSRQVATKEWLAKSPFSAAIKTVPLT